MSHHSRGPPSDTARMGRARRYRAAVPALFHGPDGFEPGGAASERRPEAVEFATALDRRHLRLSACRKPDHDGHAGRPHRPPETAFDRRGGIWNSVGFRGVLHKRRNADRRARAARDCRGDACAVDPFVDPQHVPRPEGAHGRNRRLDCQLFRRRRHRSAGRRYPA